MSNAEDFDKWMRKQGPKQEPMPSDYNLSDGQIKLLKEYPECETANDLPFHIQQDIIALKDYDNLQNEVDAFLGYQYSLLSRNFKDFIMNNREKV
jgi:hypothetical protein